MIYHRIQCENIFYMVYHNLPAKHYGLPERIEQLGKICHGDITLKV